MATVEDLQVIIEQLNQRTADYDVQVGEMAETIRQLQEQVSRTADRDSLKEQLGLAAAEITRLNSAIASLVSGTDGGKAALEEFRRAQWKVMKDHADQQLAAMNPQAEQTNA